ncbi:MAG: ABC transporter ATP-binding protein [Defluviitaleaceae bacterium]|nr:ABC transporter ATP-binding protein [Defluviitaleaceae bacterium]MCL2262299.1 ABC transporter ATP-binding protein [Defluviitaleaceae bacterium]
MSSPLLEVTDLCIGYDGKSIVDDICFCVASGSYLCIIGENGAGKSTLLKTISGLQKPIYGTVKFSVHRREIGYLPQQAVIRHDFPTSAKEIISSGALSKSEWYRPFCSKQEKERIAWASEKTGVDGFLGQCFRELSGGQQQRVLLARALVTAKNAVILDEPTAGLDPEATKEFYELLLKLNRDEKITIIMVTHDIEGAEKHATHVLELRKQNAEDDFFFGTVNEYAERGRSL